MQNLNLRRGAIKSPSSAPCVQDSGWLAIADRRRMEHQFWKKSFQSIGAEVVKTSIHEDIDRWMPVYFGAPAQFIVQFHTFIHPVIIERLFETKHLTEKQYHACKLLK